MQHERSEFGKAEARKHVCRSLAILLSSLKVIGVRLELRSESQSTRLLTRFVQLVLLLSGIATLYIAIRGAVKILALVFGQQDLIKEKEKFYFELYYSDPMVWSAAIAISVIRCRTVDAILKKVVAAADSLDLDRATCRRIRTCSVALLATCILNFAAVYVPFVHSILTASDDRYAQYSADFTEFYFGLQLPAPPYSVLVLLTSETIYFVLSTGANLFSSLVILLSYVFYCYFRRLNQEAKTRKRTSLGSCKLLLRTHQRLSRLLRQVDASFSPLILLLVCFKTVQLVLGYPLTADAFRSNYDDYSMFKLQMAVGYTITIGLLLGLTLSGGKLHTEVRTEIRLTRIEDSPASFQFSPRNNCLDKPLSLIHI